MLSKTGCCELAKQSGNSSLQNLEYHDLDVFTNTQKAHVYISH